MKTRTRFAPSPTGYMHIGNLRTAIFSYLVAKRDNGEFILRIEDTDQKREVAGAIDFIYDTLKLCNIEIDEGPNNAGNYGPYIQSQRTDIYQEYANKLVESNKAYFCFCDEKELEEQREKASKAKIPFLYNGKCQRLTKEEIDKKISNKEEYVIRQKMLKEGHTIVDDLVYGKIKVDNETLEDQILIKRDGYPTYNFANVIDDHLMNITHVMRGNEYLSQTAKYNLLYQAFGWQQPSYIHVAMVLGEDGNKLSKRNGDASFMDLYNDGYIPQAIINYLVLLGWSPESNQEIFTMEELKKEFDPKRISKSPSIYDVKKLQWVNSQYIKKLDLESFVKLVKPFLVSSYNLEDKEDKWIEKLISIYQNHISYGKEIIKETELFFKEDIEINEECREFLNSDPLINDVIKVFTTETKNTNEWTIDTIKEIINKVKEQTGAKGKILFMSIRIMVSGQMHGPELPDTIYLLGKETILNRLRS